MSARRDGCRHGFPPAEAAFKEVAMDSVRITQAERDLIMQCVRRIAASAEDKGFLMAMDEIARGVSAGDRTESEIRLVAMLLGGDDDDAGANA